MDVELFWRFMVVAWTPLLIAEIKLDVPTVLNWFASVRDWAIKHPYGKFGLVLSGILFPLDKVIDLVYADAKAKWVSPTLFILLAAVLVYGVYRRDHDESRQRQHFQTALTDQADALRDSNAALGDSIAALGDRIAALGDRVSASEGVRAEEAKRGALESEQRILQLIDERLPRGEKS